MPVLISKHEAAIRIALEKGDDPCALCALVRRPRGPDYCLEETEYGTAFLPRYARQGGHVMIRFRDHVTTYSELVVG